MPTGSALYEQPSRPRVRIYAFTDTAYATPIFEYNPFTAGQGEANAVSKLSFNTSMTNVGQCEIGIENNDGGLDPDTFRKGNRIRVDMSKDGTTFYDAFKGLVRGAGQDVLATNAQTLTVRGYHYLIRLKERIIATIIESNKLSDETYDQTDSTMFTNALTHYILNTNANYVYSQDDTELYNVVKRGLITSSPVKTWVPRVDAQFTPVSDAINELLQYSNSALMMNMTNDELILYNPDDHLESGVNTYLVTTAANKNADPDDRTMYPREPYIFDIDNDFPDHANRIVVSYGSPLTSPGEPDVVTPPSEPSLSGGDNASNDLVHNGQYLATYFVAQFSPIKYFRALMNGTDGTGLNNSNVTMKMQIRSNISGDAPGSIIGSTNAYPAHSSYPSNTTFSSSNSFPNSNFTNLRVGRNDDWTGIAVTPGKGYWFVMGSTGYTYAGAGTKALKFVNRLDLVGRHAESFNQGASWGGVTGSKTSSGGYYVHAFMSPDVSGGTPAVNADQLVIGRDTNGVKKWGAQIERAETSLPEHVIDKQTINHFLYPQLYVNAKPRISFDYPSLTMPNIPPKAGDIITHVDPLLKIGTKTTPIQTTIITDTRYEFNEGDDSVIGLRKLGLTTTGMRRGYY